jgi:hypothetical protein
VTPEDVEARLVNIEAAKGDNETAHELEDELYVDVLRAIAASEAADPQALAERALKAYDLDFTRWYA